MTFQYIYNFIDDEESINEFAYLDEDISDDERAERNMEE